MAQLLLMTGPEWEMDRVQTWLINAIRLEKIDARLDMQSHVLYVRFGDTNAYHAMLEKVKVMDTRTSELLDTLFRRFFNNITK